MNEAFLQDYHDLVISFQTQDVYNMTSSIRYYFMMHHSKIDMSIYMDKSYFTLNENFKKINVEIQV